MPRRFGIFEHIRPLRALSGNPAIPAGCGRRAGAGAAAGAAVAGEPLGAAVDDAEP